MNVEKYKKIWVYHVVPVEKWMIGNNLILQRENKHKHLENTKRFEAKTCSRNPHSIRVSSI